MERLLYALRLCRRFDERFNGWAKGVSDHFGESDALGSVWLAHKMDCTLTNDDDNLKAANLSHTHNQLWNSIKYRIFYLVYHAGNITKQNRKGKQKPTTKNLPEQNIYVFASHSPNARLTHARTHITNRHKSILLEKAQ